MIYLREGRVAASGTAAHLLESHPELRPEEEDVMEADTNIRATSPLAIAARQDPADGLGEEATQSTTTLTSLICDLDLDSPWLITIML